MVTEQDRKTLQQSTDASELQDAAVAFAQDQANDSIVFLQAFMVDETFLERLDDKEAYQQTYTGLRLSRVMNNLMQNRILMVDKLLVSLTNATPYQSNALRIQLLIHALAVIIPSPQEALVYWDRYSQPDGVLTYHVIDALSTNQSPPAMALFEHKFMSSEHDIYEKQSWMREIILPLRHDEPIILASERLIMGSLPEDNKVDFIEALFDYKPDEWYIECEPPLPPSDITISAAVRDAFIRIGEYGLSTLRLNEDLKQKVEARIEALRDSTT